MRIIIVSLICCFWSCNNDDTKTSESVDSTATIAVDSSTTDAVIDTAMSPVGTQFDLQITGVAFLNAENIPARFHLDGTDFIINPGEIEEVDLEDETARLKFMGQSQSWRVDRYEKYILVRQSDRWIVRRLTQH